MEGIIGLLASDPFQEIDSMESYISFEEHQQYLSADLEYAECFFAGNRLEEEKGEGTADDIHCIESVKEGDQDQDGNVFEIFDDENSQARSKLNWNREYNIQLYEEIFLKIIF